MKNPWEGHKIGLLKARDVLRWACNIGIRHVTAYTLSLENIKTRPKKELNYILKQLEQESKTILNDAKHIVHQMKVRVRFIGRTNELPEHLISLFKEVEERTSSYKKHFLNVAVAYGGQQEIIDAAKSIAKKVSRGEIIADDIDENVFIQNLYVPNQPMPDLILRTGGDHRLSNFMAFQSAYSELMFIDKKWPELTEKDFMDAIHEFEVRERRFGG